MFPHHYGSGLLQQRRAVLVDESRAIQAAGAADALGVVVDEMTAAVVEHARDANPAAPQVEAVRHGRLVTRRGVAVEFRGVAHNDLAQRVTRCPDAPLDNAVTLGIVVADEAARPPAVERVAFTLLNGGLGVNRRHAPE